MRGDATRLQPQRRTYLVKSYRQFQCEGVYELEPRTEFSGIWCGILYARVLLAAAWGDPDAYLNALFDYWSAGCGD
jgi:hypothetical protein